MNRIGTVFVIGFIILLFTLISNVANAVERVWNKVDNVIAPIVDIIEDVLEPLGIESRFWAYVAFFILCIIILKALIRGILKS